MELPNLAAFLPLQKADRSLRTAVLGLCLWGQLSPPWQPPVMENRNWSVTITCIKNVFLLIVCVIA